MSNLPEQTLALGRARREQRAAETAEAVPLLDFSAEAPGVPAPTGVSAAISELVAGDSLALHGYTPASGLPSLREKLAADLNARLDTDVRPDRIYVTCGNSAGLAISLRATLEPEDEVVVLAPFYPEYRVFTEAAGGKLVVVPSRPEDFQVDLEAFEEALTERTRAVIVNTPNNPSGILLNAESLLGLTGALRRQEERAGHPIYLICDEAYRELIYDGTVLPAIFNYYDDAIVCYSFGSGLSVSGERLGYIAVGSNMTGGQDVYAAITGAARSMGYVNPPSLFQRVAEKCLGQTVELTAYRQNRDLLLSGLREAGYTCVEPQGAYFLFVKTPEADAETFCARAEAHGLRIVPGDVFGTPGYARLSYCVPRERITAALPSFRALMNEYRA